MDELDNKPTLQEVLLRKAQSIGEDRLPPPMGGMPMGPGIGKLLGRIPKGSPTGIWNLMKSVSSPAEASSSSIENIAKLKTDLTRSGIYNALGSGYNHFVAPVLHGQGVPAYPGEALTKPWIKYQAQYLSGAPDEENPNPFNKP